MANESGSCNTNKALDSYFDDNFSQYFHTQFFQEISKAESVKPAVVEGLKLTQCGFSQWQDESQFDESISPGQTRFRAPGTPLRNRSVIQSTQPLRSAAAAKDDDADVDESTVPFESDSQIQVQCSQIFLQEVSALQMNITSLIDETLMANKLDASDIGDSDDQFAVFRSNVTMSEYVQLQRSPAALDAMPLTQYIRVENQATEATNGDDDENELLAAFAMDENWTQIAANGKIETNANAANGQLEKKNSESVSNNSSARKPSPVTAANFFVMGPYFGLPQKVQKLIKEFKGIDDLYGWFVWRQSHCAFLITQRTSFSQIGKKSAFYCQQLNKSRT